ncbi:MAG: glutamate--tRNA ligase [Actinobacteria bacterium]|nr:glutamate--tRNA ligase [Actinomycetota bacterium]
MGIPEQNIRKTKIAGPEPVRVRFAPSPTGYLHIGSARTAFFNWLFAKKTKGRFILRIEDTDISRHMEETIGLMMDSLKWLGITWDEGPDIGGSFGPYRQSQRQEIYDEYAKKLIYEGKAYYCFCSPEKLAEKRLAAINNAAGSKGLKETGIKINSGAEANKRPDIKSKLYRYDRECLHLDKKNIQKNLKKGMPFTIRLLVPENAVITFDDTVYGRICVDSSNMEDFIIIRSNGLPTYNFSASIDDILMEITHIIRGEDHLSNTPKQVLVYRALDKNLPGFTHLPMILGSDGQKLSKRHGSISIEAYREQGFLPEAIKNYIALLGWSYDEKSTIFSTQSLVNKFSLEKINKKPSKFDYDRLLWLNGYYIRQAGTEKLEKLLLPAFLSITGKAVTPQGRHDKEISREKLERIIFLIRERIKTLNEGKDVIKLFFGQIEYTDEIIAYLKNKKIEALRVIDRTIATLELIKNFDASEIEISLRNLSEELNQEFKKTAEIIRIAIWGNLASPPLFATVEILGKNLTLERLNNFRSLINIFQMPETL